MPWQELQGQLIVGTVVVLTTFIAYTSQILVLWNYLGGATLSTLFTLLPLNVFVIMIYVNYSLVCLTDPGTVPCNWMPNPEDMFMEVKRSTHAPRFCKTCNNYKPPRTHHCSTCDRCVLKMDHHCPWINNCVGFHNYGHFVRFIVYVEISAIYLFVLLSCRLAQVIDELNSHNVRPSNVEAAFLSINLLLAAAAIVIVGVLSGYHVYCLTTNTTTIEGWEKGTALTFKSLGRITSVKYPYNLGLYRNICAVLGSQPILWLFPQRMRGDGLSFAVRKNDDNWEEIQDDGDDDEEEEEEGRNTEEELTTLVISAPPRVHTRASSSSLHPTTPASIATFASSSTLVDPYTKFPTCTKEAFEMTHR